ncbi:hypothetical protein CVU75_00575 [Candidatus Dependentiae bacterium HGW-Dependentiae-1]|nr:MAG: hypothetical protein CVU75_00575 [Candidatus Dependentiae bacterium HGW-Dependentiae-1]
MKRTNCIAITLLTIIASCSCLIFGMDSGHTHPKKHLLTQSALSAVVSQPTETTHKKAKPQEKLPTPSLLQITRYTPDAKENPIEHDHSRQYGLHILDNEKQIGYVVFELFPEENDDESDHESDTDSAYDTKNMHGDITFMFVEKNLRRNGYGKQLLEKACAKLEQRGCQKIMLTAAPEEPGCLEKLVHFYEKAGFRLEDRTALSQIDPEEANPAVPMYKIIP